MNSASASAMRRLSSRCRGVLLSDRRHLYKVSLSMPAVLAATSYGQPSSIALQIAFIATFVSFVGGFLFFIVSSCPPLLFSTPSRIFR
ncbi:hypothetical protein UFOVP829_50 [uncultured Caudovirales phage]|uniref:Uncharacterized protein n=1 Tax=uncultured Caudovirales phage TaxID=2100421 RepID=A0A6J5NXZ5_9CAUD|nr:hypothetical protein UFOVP493_28 [uncultured Caudovirales phage]CAB4164530.1 hypothetical protein UFOVP829_50 [uncultured Caudovirales phage]CAB4177564.1 hypothetical protein UFOVP1003_12 [uncultured Caudovirales phage]CAB4187491.1 hypothetical protein UFOVP1153_28 [uncultured Caudovirales phage]